MTFLPSNVQTGACSSSSTRSLKCVPLALSSLSWSVKYESGLVRVAVLMRTLETYLTRMNANSGTNQVHTRPCHPERGLCAKDRCHLLTASTAPSEVHRSFASLRMTSPLPYAVRVHQNLAGLSGLQALHRLAEVLHRDAIGDHGMQVELAALEQRRHLIPGLIHAASIDALHRDALENNVFGKIQRDRLRG